MQAWSMLGTLTISKEPEVGGGALIIMLEVAVRGFKRKQGGVPQRLHILLNVSRAEKKSCHEDYED